MGHGGGGCVCFIMCVPADTWPEGQKVGRMGCSSQNAVSLSQAPNTRCLTYIVLRGRTPKAAFQMIPFKEGRKADPSCLSEVWLGVSMMSFWGSIDVRLYTPPLSKLSTAKSLSS